MNRLGALLIGLVLVAGGVAWGVALRNHSYDFDEVQRAHSIWMTSQGLRPYEDFPALGARAIRRGARLRPATVGNVQLAVRPDRFDSLNRQR